MAILPEMLDDWDGVMERSVGRFMDSFYSDVVDPCLHLVKAFDIRKTFIEHGRRDAFIAAFLIFGIVCDKFIYIAFFYTTGDPE
jgi:hypothetical protein